jgi:tetratricopeptide (TPR) repeat protein
MAYFDRAAEAYELVVKTYPKSQYGADALFNAGLLRQALGVPKRAIAHYEAYARRYRKRKDAPEVAFRIGVVYEEAGDAGRADRAYRDYAKRYRRDGAHVIEAHTRAGRLALSLGHIRRAREELGESLKLYARASSAEKKNQQKWAAEARYHQGELIYRDYKRIQLDVPPRKLSATLKNKTKMLEKAQSVYLEVVDFGSLQWATAALFRIGEVYEEFATSLREAPVPPGLSEGDQELYRDALESHIVQIEERAIELYTTGYRKSIELKVFNKYTKAMRQALGRMASRDFPPERETRTPSRIGDRPPALELVKEVIRE